VSSPHQDTGPDQQAAELHVVDTPVGPVRVRRDGAVLRATGIRYARAGRFQAPVAEPPSTTPLDATRPAPACPQLPVPLLDQVLPGLSAGLGADEDCLRLSVTAPADVVPGEDLPVLVWLHGGSYVSGAGDLPVYDPTAMVREQRVVVVAVTYRLGVLGFVGDGGDRPANLGLLDQLEALRWVQRAVTGFGGDPGNVTVWGHSAGGDAAAHLMVAAGSRGLLDRVIAQSAPLGISRGRAAMGDAMAARARELVDVDTPVEDAVAAQPAVAAVARRAGLRATMPFGTRYGHAPLPAEDEVDDAWRAVAPDVDVLIGHTDREVALFTGALPPLVALSRFPVLGPLVLRGVVGLLTRRVYGAASRVFARRHASAGGRAFHYVLDWGPPGNPWAGAHTVELPLLFGDRDTWTGVPLVEGAPWAEVDRQGRALRALWAGFARTGEVPVGRHAGLLTVERVSG
jgi:para-nitrobenzyl esterase